MFGRVNAASALCALVASRVALSHATPQTSGQKLEPLLTTISRTPELSKFYALIGSTGDDGRKPGADLEERFNLEGASRNFTIFAPTNNAFASLPPQLAVNLTSGLNYPLLLALIRSHIAESYIPPGNLLSSLPQIESVQGFPLSIDHSGRIVTNKGLTTTTSKPIPFQAQILKDQHGTPSSIPASNGIIYKIDGILDPWITYFGQDIPSGPTINVQRREGTMSDFLLSNPNLTRLTAALERVDPDFLHNRLSLAPDGQATTYFAPSNRAFEILPPGAMDKALESGNAALTAYLLGFGLCKGGGGGVRVFESERSGFEVVMEPQGREVGNGRVEERICPGNGCVVVVGRWLDPLYGVL
ncbi:Hypothetical predicted protein [Lecanosticta acicola]|uniref:FAS1 domain-containing protein n=1 Tax=Lecanosticta acicola TaxID=111012 RepID=A0AAI8Z5R2_9PEZI|nr:Hypothetical predicted protein [Lecanosticta acicola]